METSYWLLEACHTVFGVTFHPFFLYSGQILPSLVHSSLEVYCVRSYRLKFFIVKKIALFPIAVFLTVVLLDHVQHGG